MTGRVSGNAETNLNPPTHRDEAMRQTRRLQASIQAERDTFAPLLG